MDEGAADAALARLAGEVAERFRGFPDEAVEDLLRHAPALASARAIEDMFRTVVREHGQSILRLLSNPVARDVVGPAAYTAQFARACARIGVPAASVLRSYQRGHELVWHWWSGQVEQHVSDAESRAAVTARLAELLMAYVSSGMAVTVEVHAAETARETAGGSWRRRDAVLEIVENRARHAASRLSVLLGHDLSRWQLGFVAWLPRDDADDWTGLESAVRTWATAATGRRPLLVAVDGRMVWGWVEGTAPPVWSAAPPPLRQLRVAVGQPGRGLEGFRLSHREATLARGLADRLTGPELRYSELATVALLREDPDLRSRYVESALGDLARVGARESVLRATVRAHLRAGENVRAVARELHLHRNTVQQRLDQAEQLRGRPLAEDRLTLAVALEMLIHGADR
jgi:hypothetical protein